VALAVLNAVSVNAFGANDPRYAALSAEVAAKSPLAGLETNSYHVLDIHERIATEPVSAVGAGKGREFLWVRLPAYDAIATTVWPVERPSDGWCESAELSGAVLFRRCDAP
jgi:hypothetical protein